MSRSKKIKYILEIDPRSGVAGVKRFTGEFKGGMAKAKSSALSLKKVIATIGISYLTKQVIDLGLASIKSFAVFDEGIAEVSTLSKTVQNNMAQYRADILKISRETGQPLDKLTKGLYDAISAGVPAAKAIAFVGTAAQLAIGGVSDVSQTVNVLTGVLNAFKLEASETEKISDQLFTTVKLGKTTITELSAYLGFVAPSAKAARLETSEMMAAMAELTLITGNTSVATTYLDGLLKALAKPTKEMTALFKKYGYESGLAAIEGEGFGGVLKILNKETGGNLDEMMKLIPRLEGAKGALILVADAASGYSDKLIQVKNSAGATKDATAVMASRFSMDIKKLVAGLEAMAVTVGENLSPEIRGMVGAITDKALPAFTKLASTVGGPVTEVFTFWIVKIAEAMDFWDKFLSTTDDERLTQLKDEIKSSSAALDLLKSGGQGPFGAMSPEYTARRIKELNQELINLNAEKYTIELRQHHDFLQAEQKNSQAAREELIRDTESYLAETGEEYEKTEVIKRKSIETTTEKAKSEAENRLANEGETLAKMKLMKIMMMNVEAQMLVRYQELTLSKTEFAIKQAERERDRFISITKDKALADKIFKVVTDKIHKEQYAKELKNREQFDADQLSILAETGELEVDIFSETEGKKSKITDDSISKTRTALNEFMFTFKDFMSQTLDVSSETGQSIGILLSKGISGGLGTGVQDAISTALGDISFEEISQIFLASGAGANLGKGIAQGVAGNREIQNAAGVIGGAAMGWLAGAAAGSVGGPVGAGIGAAVGLAGGNFGPGPPDTSFGADGAGKRGDVRKDPGGALARGVDLLGQAIDRVNVGVLEKVLRQIQEITLSDYSLNLDALIPDEALAGRFTDLMQSLEPLADTVATLGLNSEITKTEMQDVSASAGQFAIDSALAGGASEKWTQSSLSLALSLNQEGAAVLKNLTAFDDLISKLAMVDDRTRGLAQSTQAQSLANEVLTNSTMFSADQIVIAGQAQAELGNIQEKQTALQTQLASAAAAGDTARVEKLQAALKNLNDQAIVIEEKLTNMTGATDDNTTATDGQTTATGKLGDATDVAGVKIDKMTRSLWKQHGATEAATKDTNLLFDSIEKLHDKEITITIWEQRRERAHTGRYLQPFEKEMVIKKNEMIVPPEKRVEFAQRVLANEAPRGVGGDGGSIGTYTAELNLTVPLIVDGRTLARAQVPVLLEMSRDGVTVIDAAGVGEQVE